MIAFRQQSLRFDNRFIRLLPGDADRSNRPRPVNGACYSFVEPASVAQPQLLIHAPDLAADLGLPAGFCASDAGVELFTGNTLLPGMQPYAMCYGGHQFGIWAGPTPYSHRADGRTVLRSSLRELLCSEAMHHLGIPTTRALPLTLTSEQVVRDMFYDGRSAPEPGAVVCRTAPSFLRFGSLQLFAMRGDHATLKRLLDYAIETDFPHLGAPCREVYLQWFAEVCRRTAELMVHWMRVGFVHGVMNSDNMSLLGLTIDYGPYGWLEDFDPDWTPNTTDREMKRYAFGRQPAIAGWNLARLGEAILPLCDDRVGLQQALDRYSADYRQLWLEMMAKKLGLDAVREHGDCERIDKLIDSLQQILPLCDIDMTIFFRRLAEIDSDIDPDRADEQTLIGPLLDACYAPDAMPADARMRIIAWLRRYIRRLREDRRPRRARRAAMNRVNPKYVLRNYLAQIAIDKAHAGDYSEIDRLHALLQRLYDEQPEYEAYAAKRPDWDRERPGCAMLSCSS